MSILLSSQKIIKDWIDYNDHMQDAYYGLAFSYAIDHFQDVVGIDDKYRRQSGNTIYVIEDHKFYLNEVKLASELKIETNLIDTDKKKFVLYSQIFVKNNQTVPDTHHICTYGPVNGKWTYGPANRILA